MKKILAIVLTLLCVTSTSALALNQDWWLSSDQYYYNQLSEEHKAAWEDDITNVLNYPNQIEAVQDYRHQALACMIKADNPKIFWIDWINSNAILSYNTSDTYYRSFVVPNGKTLADLQDEFTAAVTAAVNEISAGLSKQADRKAKVHAIYDWLCENNTYNDAQTNSHKAESNPVSFAFMAAHSAYSAIIPGDEYEPVCQGYASAFKVLCDELDVPCILLTGSMTSLSTHNWNYVQLENGQWYQVDVTTGDAYNTDLFCLMKASQAKKYEYTPNPYMGSGINPDNGYTEGAAFTVPELAN